MESATLKIASFYLLHIDYRGFYLIFTLRSCPQFTIATANSSQKSNQPRHELSHLPHPDMAIPSRIRRIQDSTHILLDIMQHLPQWHGSMTQSLARHYRGFLPT
jgi:hypothetical protein